MSQDPIDRSNIREISGSNGGVQINLQEQQFGSTAQFSVYFDAGDVYREIFRVGGVTSGPALSAEFDCAVSLTETAVTK